MSDYQGYNRIHLTRQGKVLTGVLDNPPINLITLELYGELSRLSSQLMDDDQTQVFVLKSANPDFFLAHFDVAAILRGPIDNPPERQPASAGMFSLAIPVPSRHDRLLIAHIEA